MKKITLPIILFIMVNLAFGENIPIELSVLKLKRDRKMEAINRVYLAELEKMKTRFTKKGDLKGAYQFTKDGRFKREKVTTTYIITGDSSVKIIWPGNVQIECKFSDGFTKLREVNGNKTTFFFRGVRD